MVTAHVIDKLPKNTATRSHSLEAVRIATLNTAGKNGVLYAGKLAIEIKESSRESWDKCKLIKEHVIPVSLIHRFVDRELSLPLAGHNAAAATVLVPSDLEAQGLTKETIAQFQKNPRAWQVAKIVREWTLLA